MTRRRPRTVSLSLSDRGQTNQDFAVGIGIFLLTIAFVFAYVPNFVTPFTPDVGSAETAQADRIAATVVDDLTDDPDRPNHLNATAFDERYDDEDALVEHLGLRSTSETTIDRVNISVETIDGDTVSVETIGGDTVDADALAAGPAYRSDQPAGSAARIVTVEGSGNDCDPACRLVVRVW